MKVCIIAEGTYPFMRGGASEWTHQLIEGLPSVEFDIFSLAPTGKEKPVYERLANIKNITIKSACFLPQNRNVRKVPSFVNKKMAEIFEASFQGTVIDCNAIVEIIRKFGTPYGWLLSEEYWKLITRNYEDKCPDSNFSDYFWTTYSVYSTMLDAITLAQELPTADVYHSLTTGVAGFISTLAAIMRNTPLVVSEHGMYLKERSIDMARQNLSPVLQQIAAEYFTSIVRTSYKYADFLLPICQAYAEHEVALGARPDKIKVTLGGINAEKFTPPANRNGGTPLIGCFARVVPLKDQLCLIKASKKVLENYTADFVFVGEIQDLAYYEECQSLIKEWNLQDHVKFVGHSNDIVDWYRKSDIFVLSSKTEGLPLSLLEAMSCGLPCVCTDVGGISEVISGEGVGFIVPPGNPDSLASGINELLKDKTNRRLMGMRASELVKKNYSLQNMQHRILDVYYEVFSLYRPKVQTH